jgi:hypothetical protein
MLKAHEELLAQIELSEEAARELHDKGARVDETVRLLRLAANTIKERIAHYKRDAAKAASATPAATKASPETPRL